MSPQEGGHPAGGDIPDAAVVVTAGGHEQPSVPAEVHVGNCVGVAGQRPHEAACRGLPDPGGSIFARRRDQASVGTEGGGREGSSTPQHPLAREGRRAEKTDRAGLVGHGKDAPVGAQRKRARRDAAGRTNKRAALRAPDAQRGAGIVAEDDRAVGAEDRALYRVRVIEHVKSLPSGSKDPCGAVAVRRQHESPVRAEGRGMNRLPTAPKQAEFRRRAGIPETREFRRRPGIPETRGTVGAPTEQ